MLPPPLRSGSSCRRKPLAIEKDSRVREITEGQASLVSELAGKPCAPADNLAPANSTTASQSCREAIIGPNFECSIIRFVKLGEVPPAGEITAAASSKPPGCPKAFSKWPAGTPAAMELTIGIASLLAASLGATWLPPAPRSSRVCTGTQELVELPRESEALEVHRRRQLGPPRLS
jgi:hypothetical protein